MKQINRGLILMVVIIIIASCKTQTTQVQDESMNENKITIVGIAENAKMGAVILTEDNDVYYIDGLNSWEENIYRKEVKVSGVLKVETFKTEDLKNEKGEWKQGMEGDKKTIIKSIWEIVEK